MDVHMIAPDLRLVNAFQDVAWQTCMGPKKIMRVAIISTEAATQVQILMNVLNSMDETQTWKIEI
jgi:hypothetical protein